MKAFIAPREIGQKAVVIEVSNWQGSLQEFLDRLKTGVTNWINSGYAPHVLVECRGKFTLADFADYTPNCFVKKCSLGNALIEADVPLCTIDVIDTSIDDAILDLDADTNLYLGE